jgi:hypothetical protein
MWHFSVSAKALLKWGRIITMSAISLQMFGNLAAISRRRIKGERIRRRKGADLNRRLRRIY